MIVGSLLMCLYNTLYKFLIITIETYKLIFRLLTPYSNCYHDWVDLCKCSIDIRPRFIPYTTKPGLLKNCPIAHASCI